MLSQSQVDEIAQELIAKSSDVERINHLRLTRYWSADCNQWLDVFDYGLVELAHKPNATMAHVFQGVVNRYHLSNEVDQIAVHDASIRRSRGGKSF